MNEYKVTARKYLRTTTANLTFNVQAETTERAKELAIYELHDHYQIESIENLGAIDDSEFEVQAWCSAIDDIGECKTIVVEAETFKEARELATFKFLTHNDNVVLTRVRAL